MKWEGAEHSALMGSHSAYPLAQIESPFEAAEAAVATLPSYTELTREHVEKVRQRTSEEHAVDEQWTMLVSVRRSFFMNGDETRTGELGQKHYSTCALH